MNEIITFATITILAVISPGPDFAMVTRNSYAYGIKTGLLCALGIAIGVQVHVFYTIFGITVIVLNSPMLFLIVKLLGVGYLVYIGFQSFTNTKQLTIEGNNIALPSPLAAFKNGFLTNALNPKTMFFVISVYTQVIDAGQSLWRNFSFGLFITFAHLLWFSLIALFFSSPVIRSRILHHQFLMDKVIGVLLIGLGLSLLFWDIA